MAKEYLDEHGKPTWFDIDGWQDASQGHRGSILKAADKTFEDWLKKHSARGRENPEAVAEELNWHYTGLPQGEEGASPKTSMLEHGFGMGPDAWIQFNEGQAAAQYINLKELLEAAAYPATPHLNLCGELAVSAVLDLSLKESLELFSQVETSEPKGDGAWGPVLGAAILKDRFYTTWAHQLGAFFREAEWDYDTRNSGTELPSPHEDPEAMDELLDENKSLVALVTIDGKANEDGIQDGNLTPLPESVRPISHWVTILSVIPTRIGEHLVRLYNPFQNREDVYSWTRFREAWKNTKGNSVVFHVIVATPPEPTD